MLIIIKLSIIVSSPKSTAWNDHFKYAWRQSLLQFPRISTYMVHMNIN